MNDNDRIKAQRLRAALTRRSMLPLDEARARLPELVMDQMAGEDVETRYADMLVALDQYPELAEEYAMLAEAMDVELGHQALPVPASIPQFFVEEPPGPVEDVLRRLGEHARGILVQLSPKLLPEPLRGVLSEASATYMPTIEYINEWLSDLDEPIQLTAILQQAATTWELIVSVIPGSASTWHVSATLGDDELPIVEQDQFVTRFGPLDHIPEQPITLYCVPERS